MQSNLVISFIHYHLVSGGDGMQPAGYSGRLSGEWCGSAAGLERSDGEVAGRSSDYFLSERRKR